MHSRWICLAALASFASTPALAQGRNPMPGVVERGTVHPNPEIYSRYVTMRSGKFAAEAYEREKRMESSDYREAIRFAACVDKFDRAAANRILAAPIGGLEDNRRLRRLAEVNGPCVAELVRMHPLVLRAALAEVRLRASPDRSPTPLSVGMPPVVDGYPVGIISRCQAALEPDKVRSVFATEPGSTGERDAATALFAATPQCGAPAMGRLTPTAARIALVDATYRRR